MNFLYFFLILKKLDHLLFYGSHQKKLMKGMYVLKFLIIIYQTIITYINKINGDWGLAIVDWGLGIGGNSISIS